MRFFIFCGILLGLTFSGILWHSGALAKSKVTPTPIKVVTPTPRTGGLTDEE